MKRGFLLLIFVLSLARVHSLDPGDDYPLPEAEFAGIRIGDELEAVKENLRGNPHFHFRGDRDISFLPLRPEVLIDSQGALYVQRGLFQFHRDQLYIITLYLNPARADYYSLFTTLTEKYGPPVELDPSAAVWESESLRLSLEKPLTVKYLGRKVFDELKAAGAAEKSVEDLSRARFLELF